MTMSYTGTERRIHKVFVTRNTEYHVRRNLCVGVRDRRTGDWLHGHIALKSRISGGIRYSESGVSANEGKPSIGESLFITAGTRDLVTSPVVAIERPERAIVLSYES
jgi:hypothetical protein